VTCIRLPEGRTGPQVVEEARKRGFALATGYGKLKDESFRIGHMGDHTVAGLEALLDVLGDVLR